MGFARTNPVAPQRRRPFLLKPLRIPGQSLDEEIARLRGEREERLGAAFLVLVLAAFEWYRTWTELPPYPWPLTIIAICAIGWVVWGYERSKRLIERLEMGRDGERVVAEILEELRLQGYKVYHDVPGPHFNIDHVVIGPAGIFTVETKTIHKPQGKDVKLIFDGQGIRLRNGRRRDAPVIQARAQARWLGDLLNDGRTGIFTVRPVVVIPGWYIENACQRGKRDVWVLNPKALSSFLMYEPESLSPEAVDASAHALARYCRSIRHD